MSAKFSMEEYEAWLIPLYKEYEKHQTSPIIQAGYNEVDMDIEERKQQLAEGYYSCYDFLEWLLEEDHIKKNE